MDSKPLDEQLIKDYLNGEKEALEILIGRYLRPIFYFICSFTHSVPEAEDLTQEVFLKVWKNLKRFKKGKSFKPWLFAIAKNTAFDFFRKKKMLTFSELNFGGEEDELMEENIVDEVSLPSELYERQEIVSQFNEAVQKLSIKYRLVLWLKYREDLTLAEISEILKEPLETVKSRHYRGLLAVRKLLAP